MKDFAKSIVCNSVTEKEFNTEADLRRWCMDHNYTYTPVGGGYYRLEDDKPGSKRPDLEAHVKAGNKKVGNGINVQPVTPSQKPGTKPQDKPGNNPKKPNEKEPEKPFSKYIEEAQKNGNSTEKLFYGLKNDSEKEEEKSDEALDELKKTGNKKVGNVKSEYEILKQDPSKMHPMYKKAYEEAMKKLAREEEEFKKRFEKEYGVKAKNEASDDKFAYVMREFNEGKLKTPDGKVVTDPAQAKAIAYSESKKTENGLARARNAMKCGNSQITLWKGNDSALVSDDGLVQYLENNAFETDRDKYDSQQTAIEELKKLGYRKK